jgi:class 3 adenylate cyclase/predicted ATPase
MTANAITHWLDDLGLSQYASDFTENAIDLEVLPELTEADLESLGVLLGHRKKILKAIAGLSIGAGGATPQPEVSQTTGAQEPSPTLSKAERRQLTVMFCDLVGSTALSQRLDPEDLREVMRRYQDAVAGAITRYGGYVAKFLGDGVLAYFGWPRAHEDQAERAVRAGMDAVAAVVKLKLDNNVELQARVGIATGRVVVGDLVGEVTKEAEAVAGETPNLAARLQGVAAPGQVVIGAITRLLIGETFNLNDLGAHELKGFGESVHAWQVLRAGDVDSPDGVRRVGGGMPLVGRQEELGLLVRSWEASKEGHGQAVLIQGEAGIGKSRLVEALRAQVSGEDYIWVARRCSPYHANSTLYPVIEHMKRVMDWKPEDGAEEKLEKLEAALKGQSLPPKEAVPLYAELMSLRLPEGRYAPLELSAKQKREQTLDALAGWLLEEAERTSVLNVWEDLHWADPTTLELLGLYIEQSPTVSMMNVLTYRTEFVPPWTTRSHMTPITLNRLERPEVEAMIGHQANGKAVPAEVVKHIVTKADGVPLYVEELTKSILELDYLHEETDRYTLAGSLSEVAIPATLQDSLMARLDRLPTLREVAQLGSVLGREFAYQMLRYLAPLEEPVLQEGLGQLVANELLYQRGRPPRSRYIFKHALIRDAAYQSLLKRTRQQYHQQVATLMEERFPETVATHPELVAQHYTEAGNSERAVHYWQRAGESSADASANIEAVSHFEKALELLESLPDSKARDQLELQLRIALGGPLLMTRGHGAPEVGSTYSRARELCQQLGDSPQIVPALFGMWRFYIGRGDCTITRNLGRQLLDLGKSADDMSAIVLGHYGLGFALFCYGDLKEARVQLEDGYKLYDRKMRDKLSFRLGQDPGVACLSYCALALWVLGYPDQAKRATQNALTLADELSHPFSSAYALSLACQVLQHRGEIDEVRRVSETAIGISREQGFSVWIASPTIFRGWVRSQQSNTIQGAQEAQEGVHAIVDAGMEMRRPYYLALVAECYISAGRFAEARSTLDQALAIVAKTDEHWSEAELLRLTGLIEAREDTAAAETAFQRALNVARRQGAKSWELRSATSLARLWHGQGKSDAARNLLQPFYNRSMIGLQRASIHQICNMPRHCWMNCLKSGFGYKETSSGPKSTSALPPTSDILRLTLDFRC